MGTCEGWQVRPRLLLLPLLLASCSYDRFVVVRSSERMTVVKYDASLSSEAVDRAVTSVAKKRCHGAYRLEGPELVTESYFDRAAESRDRQSDAFMAGAGLRYSRSPAQAYQRERMVGYFAVICR